MRITDKQYDALIKLSRPVNKYDRLCKHCGRKMFSYRDGGRLEPSRAIYCSYECKEDAAVKRRKENRAERRKGIKCLNCGDVFTPARNDAKFCCNACKQEAYRKRLAKAE